MGIYDKALMKMNSNYIYKMIIAMVTSAPQYRHLSVQQRKDLVLFIANGYR